MGTSDPQKSINQEISVDKMKNLSTAMFASRCFLVFLEKPSSMEVREIKISSLLSSRL